MSRRFQDAQDIFAQKYMEYHNGDKVIKNAYLNKITEFFSNPEVGRIRAKRYYENTLSKLDGFDLLKQVWVDILDMNEHCENPLKGSINFKKFLLEGVMDCFNIQKNEISEKMLECSFSLLKSKEVMYFEAMVDLANTYMVQAMNAQRLEITPMESY